MCLPFSCVATSAALTHTEHLLQNLFYFCLTSQPALPNNGFPSASKVFAMSNYAKLSFFHEIWLFHSCYTGTGFKFGIPCILHIILKSSLLVILPVFIGIRKAINIFLTNMSKTNGGGECLYAAYLPSSLQLNIVRLCIWWQRKRDTFWGRWENNINLDLKGIMDQLVQVSIL
jgi:hypothetical protein